MLIACAVARAGSTPAQAHDRCVRARCGGGVWGWGMCVSISNVFYVVFSCGVWLLARAFLCAPESGAKSCPIARAPLGGSKTTLGWWGWGVWGSQRGPRCVPSYDLASRLVCSIRAECRRRGGSFRKHGAIDSNSPAANVFDDRRELQGVRLARICAYFSAGSAFCQHLRINSTE